MNRLLSLLTYIFSILSFITTFYYEQICCAIGTELNRQLRLKDSAIFFLNTGSTSSDEIENSSLLSLAIDTGTIPPGAHLISPRKFYLHHGIYLGDGNVAHYSGFSNSLKAGPIEVVDVDQFANGKALWVFKDHPTFSNDEVIQRARSRIGESQYKILFNNCEHFCNWCISGVSYSAQVVNYLHDPFRFILMIVMPEPGLIA